jgi:predicted AlkP superfamily phosphohydrolase/phosphomutase
VVIVGFDALDPRIVSRLMAAGKLPHFERLATTGSLASVATTQPAETPVAFATFSTATNPGGHGIFDFVRRDPATYLLDQALNRYEQKSRFLPPKVVNLRRGVPVWQLLSDAGLPSVVLRPPCSYAPDNVLGRMLSGMGVPDLRGGLGTPTFYTTNADTRPEHDENLVHLEASAGQAIRTYILGPRNPTNRQPCRVDLEVRAEADGSMICEHRDGEPSTLALQPGHWSPWLRLKFKVGFLQTVRGMVRLCLLRTSPHLEFYASPVNFDPEAPLFPISSPPEYARDLAKRLGPFYTTGMVEETTGLNNGRLDERLFLAQCEEVWREREKMLLDELGRQREGMIFCLFDTTDRVQHMFWRHAEPDHPANRGRTATEFASVVDDAYRRSDAVLGRVMKLIGDDTLLMVMSDHGFASFRRAVDLNAWLHDNGYLVLKPGVEPGEAAGDMLAGVDWSRSRAYSVGLSGIFLNLQGREGQGIVPPAEARPLAGEIAGRLSQLCDPQDGARAVNGVFHRSQVYSGPYAEESPDLMVNCTPGYRLSWTSARGGISAQCFADNESNWSGDHIIDPVHVPGVLLMNRPMRPAAADLRDLAPTILKALGVPRGPAMEGEALV